MVLEGVVEVYSFEHRLLPNRKYNYVFCVREDLVITPEFHARPFSTLVCSASPLFSSLLFSSLLFSTPAATRQHARDHHERIYNRNYLILQRHWLDSFVSSLKLGYTLIERFTPSPSGHNYDL